MLHSCITTRHTSKSSQPPSPHLEPRCGQHLAWFNLASMSIDVTAELMRELMEIATQRKRDAEARLRGDGSSGFDGCTNCYKENTMVLCSGNVEMCTECSETRVSTQFGECRIPFAGDEDDAAEAERGASMARARGASTSETTKAAHNRVNRLVRATEVREVRGSRDVAMSEQALHFYSTYVARTLLRGAPGDLCTSFQSLVTQYCGARGRVPCPRIRNNVFAACLMEALVRGKYDMFSLTSRSMAEAIEGKLYRKVNVADKQEGERIALSKAAEVRDKAWKPPSDDQAHRFFMAYPGGAERAKLNGLTAPPSCYDSRIAEEIEKKHDLMTRSNARDALEDSRVNKRINRRAKGIRVQRRNLINALELHNETRTRKILQYAFAFGQKLDPPIDKTDRRRIRIQARYVEKQLQSEEAKSPLARQANRTIAATILLLALAGTRRKGKLVCQNMIFHATAVSHNSLKMCQARIACKKIPLVLTASTNSDVEEEDLEA
jgi:hypothetical protein